MRYLRCLFVALIALIGAGFTAEPATAAAPAAVPAGISTTSAMTITGVPMRPVLAGTLATGNSWAVWAGTTLSVDGPGGQILWTMNTSTWVAIGGQALPYAGKVAASAWVEQSTAWCFSLFCQPTTWNLIGPAGTCYYTASPGVNTSAWGMGDHGCWPARSNLSFYRLTVNLTEQIPLDSETTSDGSPVYHHVTLASPEVLVR